MEVDPTRMCELLVGLPAINVLAVDDRDGLIVHVESRGAPPGCPACGTRAWVKDRPRVELVDLPCFGRPTRLVWHKHRWCCPDRDCPAGSWTAEDPRVAPSRGAMTDRAGRWATVQVGREGRTVAEVARELGCDWHTVNDAVMAWGAALIGHLASYVCFGYVGSGPAMFVMPIGSQSTRQGAELATNHRRSAGWHRAQAQLR